MTKEFQIAKLQDTLPEWRPFFIRASSLTWLIVSDSIERVKWLALFALLTLECSCTTVVNRRDLYSPQPDPDLDWHRQIPITSHAEEPASPPVNR
jgi:hypothetical protein